ncbi:hypothetical protein KsCSTR_18250 [Candidatus Kuenenia stuttgartiensis]|uniref:Uncharacterized protein n=1 Tax=Kuenenia stuttgartiensis TaxID=174633 RepID=A0A6G7GNW2_KUEST|nr:hypothetical protein [Candidatus Kuenenia stuttgartiensis]QII11205.1 hypothetical protein KsCSTR_18250 [Candidatus Kuenenia stuttgartiensis]
MAIPEIANLLASVKAACDLVSSYKTRKVDKATAEFIMFHTDKLVSVQKHAHSVIERCAELIKAKEELEKKIAEFAQWNKTETQYQLKEIHRGIFVYVPKEPVTPEHPAHWLCANCWQERKKSILQAEHHHESAAAYTCHRCNTKIEMRFKPDRPMTARRKDIFPNY